MIKCWLYEVIKEILKLLFGPAYTFVPQITRCGCDYGKPEETTPSSPSSIRTNVGLSCNDEYLDTRE